MNSLTSLKRTVEQSHVNDKESNEIRYGKDANVNLNSGDIQFDNDREKENSFNDKKSNKSEEETSTNESDRLIIGAITNGNCNALNVEKLSPYFDFCVNGESVGGRKSSHIPFKEVFKKYKYLIRGSDETVDSNSIDHTSRGDNFLQKSNINTRTTEMDIDFKIVNC